jgi:hypothetical protein
MFKGKFVFLSLFAAALLCWQVLPGNVDTVNSGIVHPCSSEASGAGCCYLVCPQGDGTRFEDCGAIIELVARDANGIGIAGILATDIWLDGCTDLCLCGGSGNIDADSATTDETGPAPTEVGYTTISGDMQAGGCEYPGGFPPDIPDGGLFVIIQGVIVCDGTQCLDYWVVSPDLNCDLVVNIVDLSIFAAVYVTQPGGYDPCFDYNCDGIINIVDFAIFSVHYTHTC